MAQSVVICCHGTKWTEPKASWHWTKDRGGPMEQRSSFEQIMLGKKKPRTCKKERRKKSGKKTFHLHETELKINHLCDYRKSIYLKKNLNFSQVWEDFSPKPQSRNKVVDKMGLTQITNCWEDTGGRGAEARGKHLLKIAGTVVTGRSRIVCVEFPCD